MIRLGGLFLVICQSLFGAFDESKLTFTRNPRALKEGTYIGFIAMNNQESKIPVVLDTILSDKQGGEDDVSIGILRLSFGGFRSHEYIPQKYGIFNHKEFSLSPSFVHKGEKNGPDTVLSKGEIAEDGSFIRGEIKSVSGGPVQGEAKFHFDDSSPEMQAKVDGLFPSRSIIPEITGEYLGECDGQTRLLQLEAIKSYDGFEKILKDNSPFSGYKIYGRFGRRSNPKLAGYLMEDNVAFVVDIAFDDASYNFYDQQVKIPAIGKRCLLKEETMVCSSACTLRRFKSKKHIASYLVSKQSTRSQFKSPLREFNEPRLSFPYDRNEIDGDYYGYVHLSDIDTYQRIYLNVDSGKVLEGNNEGQAYVTVLGSVAVEPGPFEESAKVSFDYQPAFLPNRPMERFLIMGDRDPFLRIQHWSPNEIRGDWFSRSFGRVGQFHVQKSHGTVPELPVSHGKLAGRYRLQSLVHYKFEDLILDPSESNIPPAYPFNMAGVLFTSSFPTHPSMITDKTIAPFNKGQLDPFSGTLAIQFPNNVLFLGARNGGDFWVFLSQGFNVGRVMYSQHARALTKMTKALPESP